MSKGGITLEEFSGPARNSRRADAGDSALAEAQLAAFDKGYREGWDDAAKAHAEEQKAIGADLARALDDMSFTYHEARRAMLGEMRELVTGIVFKVLPETLNGSLGLMILERIEGAVKARSEVSVEITVAPGNMARVEPLLQGEATIPVRLAEEPSLGPGQAALRFASSEEIIDMSAVLAGIAEVVDGFFEGQATREG
ncbi:ABC transporter ATP-binding protein [Vannielia litorea]|uniref:FliH/SctL family protein n=1 Tax=Vannielia litorea TaxID=1217970 RepID=UPI001C96B914|nr:ABC transporter ATP-binding protein [Vannielia litorea]MBY6154483.1 ABC transporter ATP-binding protein [Vannielia litorea]